MNLTIKKYLFSLFFCFALVGQSNAQDYAEQFTSKTSVATPFNTVYTHLYNLQTDSYNAEFSAKSIYGTQSQKKKIKQAIKIKKVLDAKGIYVDMNLLPKDKNYTDSTHQKHIYFISAKEPYIYLEKIDTAWYYSKTTLANIDRLYTETYPFWAIYIDNFLANKAKAKRILSLAYWQWIAIAILILACFILFYIVKKLGELLIHKTARPLFKNREDKLHIVGKVAKALSLIITFLFLVKTLPSLHLPLKFSIALILSTRIFLIFFTAYLLSNAFKLFLVYLEKIADKTTTKLDNQLLPFLSKIVIILIYIVALLFALKELNVNVTALLAGLSIGGLALALASKDTLQNVIGSLNIFLDRPFEVGDYVMVDGVEGSVEEVGIRATRIRTLNQSLAYIPNGNLSNMTIDNYGLRVYRRWITTLGLEYSTPPEKIKEFIEKTKEIIYSKSYTLDDQTLVYFREMSASSLDIYVSIFFDVKTFKEDLSCRNDLLLEILDMANQNDIHFAFPTQTLHLVKE